MTNDKDGAALLREAIHNALSSELGDTYDCGRVWDAWHVGTMGEDDFTPVNDRVGEITETVLAALQSHGQAFDAASPLGDFQCHNCKRIVERLTVAPEKCPDCMCSSFSAVYGSEAKYRAAPQYAFDAAGVREAVADAIWAEFMKMAPGYLLSKGLCESLADAAIRALTIPDAPASVVDREITTKPVAVGETAAGVTQAPASVEPVADDVLTCDVKLPPATTVRAGCSFETLRLAISAPGRPRHFDEPDTIGSHFGNGGGLDPVRSFHVEDCEASPGFGGGDLREAVAVALWKREAERAAPNVAKGRNAVTFHDQLECEKGKWLGLADAALAALPPVKQSVGKFQRGDHVEKVSGSNWRGKVVGEYSTDLTPEGYAVESDTETGSVQIYPAKALRLSHDQRGGSGE
jgi:dihydrofolate reductase (trimethoprim resistance protein)